MKSTLEILWYGWQTRRAWWFTATARSGERFARTFLGSFWLGLSNLLSIAALSAVYGVVFKVSDFSSYVVFLGTGMVIWGVIAASVQVAPTLFRSHAVSIRSSNLHPIFYSLEEWAFQVQTFSQSFSLVILALSIFQPTLILHIFSAGLLPLFNLLLFIYWFPLLVCLLGARYEDIFQLVPIVLQLMFLLSPILYRKEALGSMAWIADFNPLYRVLSGLRHSLITGELRPRHDLMILLFNLIGLCYSVHLLGRQKRHLPFIV
jgi:lipopolysaccharide transport system permease protein